MEITSTTTISSAPCSVAGKNSTIITIDSGDKDALEAFLVQFTAPPSSSGSSSRGRQKQQQQINGAPEHEHVVNVATHSSSVAVNGRVIVNVFNKPVVGLRQQLVKRKGRSRTVLNILNKPSSSSSTNRQEQ